LRPPYTGKSHIATALAVEAVKAGKIPLADLIAPLAKAEREGTLRERIRFPCRSSLLVVDEIGSRRAMILKSNRGFAERGDVFGNPVVATALQRRCKALRSRSRLSKLSERALVCRSAR